MATLGIVETSFPSALAESPYSSVLEGEFEMSGIQAPPLLL